MHNIYCFIHNVDEFDCKCMCLACIIYTHTMRAIGSQTVVTDASKLLATEVSRAMCKREAVQPTELE